jgi:multimeric flavodoxin WrbA
VADTDPRKGQPTVQITEREFRARLRQRFVDPAYATLEPEIELVATIAHDAYADGRKAPHTRKAGTGYHDPDYELSLDWIEASARIAGAAARWRDESSPTRILLISGSPRHQETCPGEEPKSHRLVELARATIADDEVEVDVLDLGRITAEYGRMIHPCKGCVSTAMPLCHWPCSCYPNHALGQVHDWMNDIYARWTAAHGVMIVTPVHWFQAPSVLKLMIDRLVCADGGNADPTRTGGKNPKKAKQVELDGWDYPKHLAGRAFSLVVHGDVEGVGALTSALRDWLTSLGLVPAGPQAILGRYVGYMRPYATSHADLDDDEALMLEVRNAAATLLGAARSLRRGEPPRHDIALPDPRPK